MVFPPKKFAWVVCGDINHVKFSCFVKFSFKDLFTGEYELWDGWFEHCGFFTLEEDR